MTVKISNTSSQTDFQLVLNATRLSIYRVLKTVKFETNALRVVTAFTWFYVSVNLVNWVQKVILNIFGLMQNFCDSNRFRGM